MELTEFHIHVDATILDADVARVLRDEHEFVESNFCGHPERVPHFEPNHHLTLKCFSGRDFRRRFQAAESYLSTTATRGYLEGEYIASDVEIEERPFDPTVSLNVRLQLRRLQFGTFRETELHITMDRDRSDPALVGALCETGMFAAFLPKPYGTAVIFTAQGDRRTVTGLKEVLTNYLRRAHGAVACSIKEERIIRWWRSHPDVEVPPVIADVCLYGL